MLVYVVRRLVAAVPVLLAASVFVFLLVDISGDPLENLRIQQPPPSEATIQDTEERLYLDRSTPERYWLWLTGWGETEDDIGLLQGKFGPSARGTGVDVGEQISSRLLITLRLVLVAVFLSIVVGVVTGVVSAVRQYSKTDHVLTFFGFLGLAMPIFWIAALIKEAGVFANARMGETVFYTVGAASADTRGYAAWETFTDVAGHMVLPTIALVINGYAVVSRFQRDSMLEVLNSDYVRLARAKGLRSGVVMRRHALRTALIPVTTIAVLTIALAINGVLLTETVFQWNGLGRLLIQAAGLPDGFMLMAWLMLTGVLVVGANLVADLLYAVLDPRIRYE